MPTFDTFIFDLDGTVLDTLPDLVVLTNKALDAYNFPLRNEAEILSFVGNGARALMYQAVPQDASEQVVEEVIAYWKSLYSEFGTALTTEYAGMSTVLAELKARGKKLGLLSNKFDGGVKDLEAIHFPGIFDAAYGECDFIPRKPDPTGLLYVVNKLGSTPEKTIYVGDSRGDMVVANKAGVFALGVSWGYQSEDCLCEGGSNAIIHKVSDLLNFA